MSSPNLLIIDANNSIHRSFFAMGDLSYKGVLTGAVFGFFQEILRLQKKFDTDLVAFCFDCGDSYRVNMLPSYKSTRREKRKIYTPEEKKYHKELYRQLRLLRDEYLPEIGFRNIFYKEGFEADDLIATTVQQAHEQCFTSTIVSTDKDLYQLLNEMVDIWNPPTKKLITFATFEEEWGLSPKKWARAKAIAGDVTDDVPGIDGVGLKTAAKYLRKELKKTTQAYQAIKANKELITRNMGLVKLPYVNTPMFELREDEVTKKKWIAIAKRLGMKTIRELL